MPEQYGRESGCAGGAVDFNTAGNAHKTKNFIAIDRIAAVSHLKINAFEVAVNHQHIVHIGGASVGTFLKMKFFRTADFSTLANTGFTFLKFDVEIENIVEVGFVFDDGRIKIGSLLKSQLFDDLVQCTLVPV